MKKVLFATTALVAAAGAASAEVLISGNAEMGLIVGDGGVAPTDGDVEFFTDIDVTFTMSGTTDSGLTYGANIDLDESDGSNINNSIAVIDSGPDGVRGTDDDFVRNAGSNGASNAFAGRTQGGESIFLSGAFGTLTAGDTDGALDWALTEVAFNSGSLNDDETEHAGYNGNAGLDGIYDGQIVRYDYSIGDFGIAVSAEIDDADGGVGSENDPALGIGAKYSLDLGFISGVGVALGYQNADDAEAIGASLNGTVYGFNVGVSYLERNGDSDASSYEHFGIGLGYVTGAISVSANYGEYDFDDDSDQEGFGLSAGYDLGGGAIVQMGYGNSDFSDGDDFDTFSFGVRMNF